MQFTPLVSSRPESQTFKMALNKGINKFWTPWMLKCKRKLTCLVLSRNQEMKTSFIFKKSGFSTSGVCGGKILYQERDIKNDNQRLHFEELHASGMVQVCASEAYAYVITSKQVLKSLCQLWAGSAYGLEHAEVCRVCSPGGYRRLQSGMNSVINTLLFLLCFAICTMQAR